MAAFEQSKPREVTPKAERLGEVAKEVKELPKTPEAFGEFVKTNAEKVKETSFKTITSGTEQIEKAVASLGGGPEDIKRGKEVIKPIQGEISALAEKTLKEIQKLAPGEKPEKAKPVGLKDTYTLNQLKELREKTKDDYGEGLVSKYRKEAKTLADRELAQRRAYEALEEKIKIGVVKPDSITSDMLYRLELRGKPEIIIKSIEQIPEQIGSELKELTAKGFIKEGEGNLILTEAEKFAQIYVQAFPDADPQQVFEITRDNARKLAYQTERDKQVFSGSDHGTRHILEGDMRMAERIIESLGNRVTPKDKVLIHQIIVDHDLGYTVGVAQAKESFAASKDHPLFSAKFIEANREYYIRMFGEEGYEMIKDGVLMHSLVRSEYGTPTHPEKGFNPDIIRSITSTVDALGVTAETKCPAFFREPEVIKVFQKLRLYADTHGGNIPPEVLAMYKARLRAIAAKEPVPTRREGFYSAIENHFNPEKVEMTLGQYAGILKDIKIIEREGKMIPHISMDISRVEALLSDLFGDQIALKAFVKAMEDFGVSKDIMADMAKVIRQIRETKTEEERKVLREKLRYSSDKAVFEFTPEFADITPEITKAFDELEHLSIRSEIRDLVRRIESEEAHTPESIDELLTGFNTAIVEKIDGEELEKIREIQERIRTNINNPNEFSKALKELSTFITKREKEFMGI